MKYQSTRNNKISVDSALAIKCGISPEGGLYVPETIPAVSLDDIKKLSEMKYTQRASKVLGMFLTDFTKEELDECALAAYAKEKEIPAYISLEERMACGIGACLGCICPTKNKNEHTNVNNSRICKDGPVFNAGEVVFS